jgi:hypothetical protein
MSLKKYLPTLFFPFCLGPLLLAAVAACGRSALDLPLSNAEGNDGSSTSPNPDSSFVGEGGFFSIDGTTLIDGSAPPPGDGAVPPPIDTGIDAMTSSEAGRILPDGEVCPAGTLACGGECAPTASDPAELWRVRHRLPLRPGVFERRLHLDVRDGAHGLRRRLRRHDFGPTKLRGVHEPLARPARSARTVSAPRRARRTLRTAAAHASTR